MTDPEFTSQINEAARAERAAGATIEINEALPYVALKMSDGSEYFFQGDEASDLLRENDHADLDCSVEDSILWSAQGW